MNGLLAAALSIASAIGGAVAPADPVRVKVRAEIPWVVAIVPVPGNAPPASMTRCADPARPQVRALLDAGGSLRASPVDPVVWRGFLAEAGGPPEAEALVVDAVRSCGRGPLFVEGRAQRDDTGRLTRPPAATKERLKTGAGGHRTERTRLPLAPAPGLFDVEGAALEVLVEDALRDVVAPVEARVVVDGHADRMWLDVPRLDATRSAAARAALDALVASPLPPRDADELFTRAAGRVAARRAAVGGWARDMARMWLAFGVVDAEPLDAAMLAVRVRARVFPTLLFP